ncbi:MAG: hypothetical protein H5T96_09670, partial [Tissierellales bacterium]|nr:hypothetical protein [Tissierellales bacterium]
MADGTPIINRLLMEREYGGYNPSNSIPAPMGIPFEGLSTPVPNFGSQNQPELSPLEKLRVFNSSKDDPSLKGGGIPRTAAQLTSPRYPGVNAYSDYNNEEAYAQGQSWGSKMVNGVGKGLVLTGTTYLQTTIGALNGLYQWGKTGKASSFYNNDLNKWVDEVNKYFEDRLPNYYTEAEKSTHWYSPSKIFSANFLWDGIVKNLGFSAGAALSGMTFAGALRALPLTARLFSVGKAAEALAATEKGLMAADKVAGSYGEIKALSDKFLSAYKVLNPGGRALVAGLSTSGEASFEAYNNMNDYRNAAIEEYKQLHEGQEPIGIDLDNINAAAEEVGNSSYLLNVALLSATNYIQF